MQAIASPGNDPYAGVNDIVILRRQNGPQQATRLPLFGCCSWAEASQNIQLQSGDTVVVP